MPKIFKESCTIVAIFILFLPMASWGLCVKASRANLRAGPSSSNKIVWKVNRFMPFYELEFRDSWYKVRDVDGDVEWIHESLVTKEYKCAVVKVDRANVRSGPGTNHRISVFLVSAEKYSNFKLLKSSNGWAKLEDEWGDKFWINRKLLWVN